MGNRDFGQHGNAAATDTTATIRRMTSATEAELRALIAPRSEHLPVPERGAELLPPQGR